MKKFKKVLLSILSLALVAILSIGGTIAYLTSEDSDVNVMTMGNVKIDQIEQEWNEAGELVDFTQDKPLYPYVGELGWSNKDYENGAYRKFTMENVVDKYVSVKNTGKSEAYVRTIIAIEIGDLTDQELADYTISASTNSVNGSEFQFTGAWNWTDDFNATIDGKRYNIMVAVHEDAVKPNEETIPSLLQVYLNKTVTNEQVERIDENGNGKLDILVLSQGTQTNGFANAISALDESFGDVTAAKVDEWFKAIPRGFKVSNNEELAEAIAAGETEIYLNKGTYNMPAAAKGKTLTINGTKDSVIEVKPAGQGEAGGQLDYSLDGSTVTFNGVTIKTNSNLYAGFARLSATYNDCVIQNTYNLGVGTSVFNNCVFNITNEYLRVGGAYSAEFNNCVFNTDGRAILVYQDGTSVDQTVTVKDCTFNATAPANTWNGIHVAAVSIDGTKGKYVVNLEGTNTVDSDFNGLWQIKTGAANVTVND